ncbi:TPA: hypothetical protein ACIJX2_000037 [Serratia marcescens]
MINKVLNVTMALTLCGCATFGQMDEGLNKLIGKDKKIAFQALGYPTQSQEFDGDQVYTWANTSSGVALYSTPQTTYGTVGTTSFYGTTTQTNAIPVEYNCKIQIVTDANSVIKNYNYDGNMGGCEGYIRRLNSYFSN